MGVAWLGGTTCCHGASAGGPCGIGLIHFWGLGRFVARHWLVDDGLWGLPFGLVGSEGGGLRTHG